MGRFLNMVGLMTAFAAVFVLYAVKDDTRKLQRRVQNLEQLIQRRENEIVNLKAERAHLARPERIEALARAQGMRPRSHAQYGRIEKYPLATIDNKNASNSQVPQR